MGKNLELKIKINSDNGIKKKLKGLCKFVGVLNQKDVYYKIDAGLLKLRIQNGEYFLIKYLRDETSQKRWSNYEILEISSNNAESFLSSIFEVETIVEKERKLYMYNNTRIHIDTVKNLGLFIELETVIEKITEEEGEKEFSEVVEFLNLDLDKQLKTSYRNLLLNNQYN